MLAVRGQRADDKRNINRYALPLQYCLELDSEVLPRAQTANAVRTPRRHPLCTLRLYVSVDRTLCAGHLHLLGCWDLGEPCGVMCGVPHDIYTHDSR